ncbi:MAG: YdeI/OmpD-associated family protein [Paracoccaceae bacterium]|jgi:hypothetical protein|nr:YdeI/OmpD-associated family protein [Paracoccaceae bacterium]
MFEPWPIAFEASVDRHDHGKWSYACIYLPAGMAEALRAGGAARPRFEGEIAGRDWQGAAQPAGEGRAYLILSGAFLRRAGIAEGDRVSVGLRPVAPNTVRVPAPLAEALAAAPDLAAVWEGLTPGARRGFAHLVAGAKRAETVSRRVSEVLAALESDDPSPQGARRTGRPGRGRGRA